MNGSVEIAPRPLTADEPPMASKPMLSHGHRLLAELPGHEVVVVHHIPGRVRLKVPLAYGDPTMLHRMKEALDKMPAVTAIEIRYSSASLVLHYGQSDPGTLTSNVGPPTVGMGEAAQMAAWPVSGECPSARRMIPVVLAATSLLEICMAAAPPLWLSLALLFLKTLLRHAPATLVMPKRQYK